LKAKLWPIANSELAARSGKYQTGIQCLHGQYIADNKCSTWVKIKNPNYSQAEGREELFELR